MNCLRILLGLMLALFAAVTFAQMVDINTATADQLEKGLKGIGPAKAAAIVKYRNENGPFAAVDDLVKVPGVGDKTLAGIKNSVTVGGGTQAAPVLSSKRAAPSTSTMSTKIPTIPATPAKPAAPGTMTMPATPAKPAAPMAPGALTVPPKPKASVELPKQ